MKTIIGKRYQSRDNSYEINLSTTPYTHKQERDYIALNGVECTIVTEPFKMKVKVRDDTHNLPTHIEEEFVILQDDKGESHLQLFFEDSVIDKKEI